MKQRTERETRVPLSMASIPKGMTWLAILLLLSQWASISCVEEEALLLDDKDFCTVPGAADVSGCEWIVEQLEDQNPDLTYDFFCSKEKDCDSQFAEGEVVDWFFAGCNGPKIVDRLCGCCVFIRNVPPAPPTNLEASEVTSTSATITWNDGAMGFPTETYTVRCFEGEGTDCRSTEFAEEVTGIMRGTEEATISDLEPNTMYTCFVLAVNDGAPDGICSDPLEVETDILPVFKLALGLQVNTCQAFNETAVIQAFCEAFIEEALFPAETVCLTDESSCPIDSGNTRRRLNDIGQEATIALVGDFGGQTREEVRDAANAVLEDEERRKKVQDDAVELLNARGTEDLAIALNVTEIEDGTSAVEDAEEPECIISDDCDKPLAPVCNSGFCVACRNITIPALQGNCEGGNFCRLNGSCLATQCENDADCGPGKSCDDGTCVSTLEVKDFATTTSTITLFWDDIPPGLGDPESYRVQCFEESKAACNPERLGAGSPEVDIPRGTEEGTISDLSASGEYTCFVLARIGDDEIICSDPTERITCNCAGSLDINAQQGTCGEGEFCRAQNPSPVCVPDQCSDDTQCGGDTPLCLNKRCEECSDQRLPPERGVGGCGEEEFCRLSGACSDVQCGESAECGADLLCNDGSCVECRDNEDCISSSDRPRCDADRNECAACEVGEEAPVAGGGGCGEGLFCRPAGTAQAGTCQPTQCSVDGDCIENSLVCFDSSCEETREPDPPEIRTDSEENPSLISARSVLLRWDEGTSGIPRERYGVLCLDPDAVCPPINSDDLPEFDIERGVRQGVVGGLEIDTAYNCFVLAKSGEQDPDCSSNTLEVTTPNPLITRDLSPPADAGEYGFSVALSADGQIAAVGAPGTASNRGAAFILRFVDESWGEPVIVMASELGDEARFGEALDLEEEDLAVGAPGENKVYLYDVDDLMSSERSAEGPDDSSFGRSVSLSGETLVVGSVDKVFIYSTTDLEELQEIEVEDVDFGASVAVSGDTLVVGAPDEDTVYVYIRPEEELFNLQVELQGPDDSAFGSAVAVREFDESGVVVLVGAPGATDGGFVKLFILDNNGTVRSEVTEQPSDVEAFGSSVAVDIEGNVVRWIAGDPAFQDDVGAAFSGLLVDGSIISRSGPLEQEGVGGIGRSVAIAGARILLGAPPLPPTDTRRRLTQNSEGSAFTEDPTDAAIPGAPSSLQVIQSENDVEVRWSPGLEGDPQEVYAVSCLESRSQPECALNDDAQIKINLPRSEREVTFNSSEFDSGTRYTCFVTAYNFASPPCGVQSDISFTRWQAPGEPSGLVVQEVGAAEVTIGWNDPVDLGIPEATFVVKCVAPNEECSTFTNRLVTGIPAGVEQAEVTGLDENTSYECFVVATNSLNPYNEGTGEGGECSSEGIPVQTLVLPGAPVLPRLDARTDATIALAWTDGEAGIPSESYAVICVQPGGSCTSTTTGTSERDIERGVERGTVTDLGSGQRVLCFATALNNLTASTGVCSSGVTSQTARLPPPPEAVSVDTSDAGRVVLTWTDGTPSGVPTEFYATRCVDLGSDCDAEPRQGTGQSGISRGEGRGLVSQLDESLVFTCYVVATNSAGETCSSGRTVQFVADACSPQTVPAEQGDCPVGEFCREDGLCTPEQCNVGEECGGVTPICDENECKPCSDQQTPAVQSNCPLGRFCSGEGRCQPPEEPGVPRQLTLQNVAETSVDIAWVQGKEGFPQERYTLKCVLAGDQPTCTSPTQGAPASDIPRDSEEAVVEELSRGTSYVCFVVASNAATGSEGTCSNGLAVQTLREPSTPLDVTASSLDDTSVTLSWSDGTAGVPSEQYRVQCQEVDTVCNEEGSLEGIAETGIPRGRTSGTATLLVANQEYDCFAIAYNQQGTKCSTAVRIRTERQECSPSRRPAVQGDCNDGDFCRRGQCFSEQCAEAEDCGGTAPVCSGNSCEPCNSVAVVPAVQGDCQDGFFCASTGACLAPDAPGPPGGLAALDVRPDRLRIAWTFGARGFPQETYTVKCVPFGEDCEFEAEGSPATGISRTDAAGADATTSQLTPGTEYSCFVVAINAAGEICSSALDVATSPAQPTEVKAEVIGVSSVTLAWTDGTPAGDLEETFEVTCVARGATCNAPAQGTTETGIARGTQEGTVTDLADATSFTCFVVARNDAGATCSLGLNVTTGEDQCQPQSIPAVRGDCPTGEFCREGGSCSVDQCDAADDCSGTEPICDDDNTCVECSDQQAPAVQGNCPEGQFCRVDGSCSADQCTSSDDCGGTEPICNGDNTCVECSDQQIPAVQSNCPDGTLCRTDGSCLPNLQPSETFEVDVLLDDCTGARFLDWCKLDERENGVTRITSNVPVGGPDSALETTTTCDTADKASGFGVFAPVGLFNGITFEEFVESLDTLGYELFKSSDAGCDSANEESAPRLEIVVNGPVGQERRTTSFTLEPTYTMEFNNGPVTNNEWIEISSGPDDGSGVVNCNNSPGGLGFYTTGYSSVFGFTGFFLDFRCSLSSWIETLKNEGFSSFVEEGTIVGLTFSLGSFNAGVEGYVNGLHVKTNVFDWTWTFVATN